MIPDQQQELAALYALDSLGETEVVTFERELAGNVELQTLVRELRDAAAGLALTAPQAAPAPAVKQRLMEQVAAEATQTEPAKVIRPAASAFRTWLPWAIAAALAIFCGVLAMDRSKLQERLAQEVKAPASKPILVTLAPAEGGPAKARAVVAWDAEQQVGTIRINNLPAAGRGKDYQLWAVDGEHKDPISAGVVRVGVDGTAQVQFKPTETARQVKAFAISLEAEGGVPVKEGPILLVGSA